MSAKVLPLQKPNRSVWAKVPVKDGSPDGPFIPNLLLNTDSGIYYVRKFKAGKGELFATTGETTKSRARTKAEAMIDDWKAGRRPTPSKRRRVEQVVDELAEVLKEEFENGDRSAVTAGHDAVYLPQIKEFFGAEFIDEFDEEFWADWVRTVGKKKERTLFDLAKYLSKVLTFAHRRKYIMRKPAIKNPDKPRKIDRVPTLEALKAVIAHCDDELLLQVVLGAENGNRTGEVITLAWPMVHFTEDEDGREITIIRFSVDKAGAEKGRGREFQVSARANDLLRARYRTRNPKSPYVFPMFSDPSRPQTKGYQNKRWRAAVNAAGIRGGFRFYDLRHFFYTTTLLELGLPIQNVSEFGGTSIKTLQKRYLHSNAQRTKEVSKAIRLEIREKSGKGDL